MSRDSRRPPGTSGPGTWRHLVRRFFDVLLARPLTDREHKVVEALLSTPEEIDLFFNQNDADQRHGLEAASEVALMAPGRPELVRAALLHDIGKQVSGLGVWGRSLASMLAKLHLPVRGRLHSYLEHGPIGADLLERAGVEPIVVAFARSHHARRPESIAPEDWAVLIAADEKPPDARVEPIR